MPRAAPSPTLELVLGRAARSVERAVAGDHDREADVTRDVLLLAWLGGAARSRWRVAAAALAVRRCWLLLRAAPGEWTRRCRCGAAAWRIDDRACRALRSGDPPAFGALAGGPHAGHAVRAGALAGRRHAAPWPALRAVPLPLAGARRRAVRLARVEIDAASRRRAARGAAELCERRRVCAVAGRSDQAPRAARCKARLGRGRSLMSTLFGARCRSWRGRASTARAGAGARLRWPAARLALRPRSHGFAVDRPRHRGAAARPCRRAAPRAGAPAASAPGCRMR